MFLCCQSYISTGSLSLLDSNFSCAIIEGHIPHLTLPKPFSQSAPFKSISKCLPSSLLDHFSTTIARSDKLSIFGAIPAKEWPKQLRSYRRLGKGRRAFGCSLWCTPVISGWRRLQTIPLLQWQTRCFLVILAFLVTERGIISRQECSVTEIHIINIYKHTYINSIVIWRAVPCNLCE